MSPLVRILRQLWNKFGLAGITSQEANLKNHIVIHF